MGRGSSLLYLVMHVFIFLQGQSEPGGLLLGGGQLYLHQDWRHGCALGWGVSTLASGGLSLSWVPVLPVGEGAGL